MKSFREITEQGLPIHVFPNQIKDFIEGFSKGSGTQPSFATAGVLACSAGVIDNSSLEVKYGYIEKPNLFIAVVGNPGVSKSPPLKAAIRPLLELDKKKHEEYAEKMDFYKKEIASMSAKEARGMEPPPIEPSKLVTDGTMEGLISNLRAHYENNDQPHAVYMRDELKGHFGGMDKYRQGGGDDYESWLTLFSGGPISRVLRSETIFIPDVRATVIGGIQPEVYHEHMQDKGDGMIDRFMVAYHDGAPEKSDIFNYVEYDVIKAYNEFMLGLNAQPGVDYSFFNLEKGRRGEVLNCVQDFFDWTHTLGVEYDCGAFKKWEQQFCRLCIHIGRMHCREFMSVEIIEMAKELAAFFAIDWLKSRITGDDEVDAKVDGKVFGVLRKARMIGCTASEIRQKIWDFRGKEKKKFFDASMDRMRSNGSIGINSKGRFILAEFVGGGLDV